MAIIVPATAGKIINLGRAGENLATTVVFDVNDWIKSTSEGGFGSTGTFALFVQQGGGGYYLQTLEESSAARLTDGLVKWNVTEANTTTVGLGKCELAYTINQVIVKSIIYDIVVTNSLDTEAQGSVPTPVESWINEVSQLTDQIIHAADYADESEQWAKGTKGGTPVTSGQIGYQDNSKYYSEQAAEQKELAAKWADSNNSPTGTPTTTNNARYYSDLARNWANNNTGSTSPSSTNNARYFSQQSERYAKGTQDGSTISSGNGYQDNSKYYSEKSSQWATGGTTGTPSSTNNSKYFAQQAERWAKGTQDGTAVTSGNGYHDNSKYYSERIQSLEAGTVTTGDPGTDASASVSLNSSTNKLSLNLTIPRGDQGYGLKVVGTKTSQSQLPSASSAGAGTAYGVGSSAPYNIYISTGTNSGGTYNGWVNYGPIGGTTTSLITWTA